jgi:hypothetical protein
MMPQVQCAGDCGEAVLSGVLFSARVALISPAFWRGRVGSSELKRVRSRHPLHALF